MIFQVRWGGGGPDKPLDPPMLLKLGADSIICKQVRNMTMYGLVVRDKCTADKDLKLGRYSTNIVYLYSMQNIPLLTHFQSNYRL